MLVTVKYYQADIAEVIIDEKVYKTRQKLYLFKTEEKQKITMDNIGNTMLASFENSNSKT